MARKSTLKRVRKGKGRGREAGYIVTWDVDSSDRPTAGRLYRFVWGYAADKNGKRYHYPGFVEKPGVRYLGQSVVFVKPGRLNEIDSFLSHNGVDHEISPATIG